MLCKTLQQQREIMEEKVEKLEGSEEERQDRRSSSTGLREEGVNEQRENEAQVGEKNLDGKIMSPACGTVETKTERKNEGQKLRQEEAKGH